MLAITKFQSKFESSSYLLSVTVDDVFQVGFISEATQGTCSKNARILLTHLTSKHPHLLSDILKCVKKNLNKVGSLSLYLFEDLPLVIWRPLPADMVTIGCWLTQNAITSEESKLARMILSRLNWGLTEKGTLFLPYSLHFEVALLIAEAVEQEPNYLTWAWQMAFRLRLHVSDKGFSDLSRITELENLNIVNKGKYKQNYYKV